MNLIVFIMFSMYPVSQVRRKSTQAPRMAQLDVLVIRFILSTQTKSVRVCIERGIHKLQEESFPSTKPALQL
jgi:hypothetical protein